VSEAHPSDPPAPASPSAPLAPRPLRRWPFVLLGLATLLALVVACVHRTLPPLPRELSLSLAFPPSNPGHAEPLVAAGTPGHADFLVVNYLDATTATFSYDYWGFGGPTSAPVTITPGRRQSLRLVLPALNAVRGSPTAPTATTAPLLLEFEGREILRQDVAFHLREPTRIFFGQNPLGGTSSGTVFRGKIHLPNHHVLRGSPTALFSTSARLRTWAATRPGEVAVLPFLALLTAVLAHRVVTRVASALPRRRAAPSTDDHTRAPHAWFLGTVAVCALAFSWVVTGGTFRFIFPESFGVFYDYQAASLLAGRLDVPEAALQGEAFRFDGKLYGYFGPTPALLRLPFTFAGVAFGELSRSFLLAYYLASLAAVYALFIDASRLLPGRPTWPARLDVVLLVGSAGLGSTLFFLSSRAYIYHEAILCGVAFALWSSWCSLRWLAAPSSRLWLGALLLGTLSVHARPPVGLFALTLLGCVAAHHLIRASFAHFQSPSSDSRSQLSALSSPLRFLLIGASSVLGVCTFNGLSYLKFKSFDGAPLKYHVQYHPARLAHIAGKNFHVSNFRYNADGYLWRPNFLVRPTFPYFFAEGRNPNDYPGAKIDLAEPTLALPYAAPALVFLALCGGLVALVRWPGARTPLGLLACAAVPMSTALFLAVAISHRYTADFLPPLLIATTFGLAAFALLPRPLARTLRATAAILAVVGVLLTAALTLHYQGELVWGVPADVTSRYQSLRQSADTFLGLTPHDR